MSARKTASRFEEILNNLALKDSFFMLKIKVCGITNIQDAEMALRSGADAIGLVFADSPRQVTVLQARRIIDAVGPWMSAVGVFVNEKPDAIRKIASECGLSCVQLHGNEKPADVKKLKGLKIIKAFRIKERADLSRVTHYSVDAFLFDAKSERKYGGTGESFDWNILKARKFSKPFIVSGGLNPLNVASAVKLLQPYGVDVSSGVERSPGKKDPRLAKEFIRNAKAA